MSVILTNERSFFKKKKYFTYKTEGVRAYLSNSAVFNAATFYHRKEARSDEYIADEQENTYAFKYDIGHIADMLIQNEYMKLT